MADHQATVQPCRDDVRAEDAPGRVERGAHRLAGDGAGPGGSSSSSVSASGSASDSVPHAVSSRRASRTTRGCSSQIHVPVPQPAPQGLGAGDAVPHAAQPTQPGRMVPRKVGGILRAVAVADGVQHVDGQQAGQGDTHPTAAVPVVRDGHQAADGRVGEGIELWDHGGHEGCRGS